jgi:hypothetical protein
MGNIARTKSFSPDNDVRTLLRPTTRAILLIDLLDATHEPIDPQVIKTVIIETRARRLGKGLRKSYGRRSSAYMNIPHSISIYEFIASARVSHWQ